MSLSKPAEEPVVLDELRTPLQIVNRMNWVLFYLRKSTHAIDELRNTYVDAKDAYSKASKITQISLAGQGAKEDRENRAQVENWELYDAMQTAEKALAYAKEKRKDLEVELSAIQSETKLVIAEMQLAGRGAP